MIQYRSLKSSCLGRPCTQEPILGGGRGSAAKAIGPSRPLPVCCAHLPRWPGRRETTPCSRANSRIPGPAISPPSRVINEGL